MNRIQPIRSHGLTVIIYPSTSTEGCEKRIKNKMTFLVAQLGLGGVSVNRVSTFFFKEFKNGLFFLV